MRTFLWLLCHCDSVIQLHVLLVKSGKKKSLPSLVILNIGVMLNQIRDLLGAYEKKFKGVRRLAHT